MTVKELINSCGITPNKALGQNFLVNTCAIESIVAAAEINGKNVLEIGPGLGSVTFELNKYAKSVLAVELDKAMVDALTSMHSEFSNPDCLEIINADFLKVSDSLLEEKLGEDFVVVANLPYYVTTPICMKLLQSGLQIQAMVLMMQKEASERFFAKCGTKLYAPAAILTDYLYNVSKILDLSPDSYYPQPEINSIVLKFVSKNSPLELIAPLSKILKAAFANRRKTIQNNIMSLGVNKQEAQALLIDAGLACNMRAEQITTAEYIRLTELIISRNMLKA